MRYHRDSKNRYNINKPSKYSVIYKCNHPLYNECTLYLKDNKGLAVIQHKFNKSKKILGWSNLDNNLADDIYLSENFKSYFKKIAAKADMNGLYPTVTVRQIMWALRMKPLPKEFWEKYLAQLRREV